MPGRARANGEGSIFTYRNGFAAYVWVTKPNGTRDRKYVYGKTREEAHAKWIKLQHDAKQGPVATRVPTLGQYMTYWLDDVIGPNRAPLTRATYESLMRIHILPGLGGKKVDKLSVRDVQAWLNKLAKTCQCCAQGKDASRPEEERCCSVGKCCKAYLSARSIKGVRAVLRSALSNAQVDELVSRNVAELVQIAPVRRRSKKSSSWTSDEARAFLEAARADEHGLYAAFILVLILGLRKGEVLGLTWADVNLDEAELSIEWQLQRVGHQLLHRETKTEESDASLPVPPIVVAALRRHRLVQEDARKAAGDAWHESDFVFTTRWGTPVEPRNFNRTWDLRCAAAGVRRITVHDARRTCASLLVDLDVHPRVAMQILRHADFSITMEVYAQVSSKQTRDALKRLADSLDRDADS